MSNSGGTGVTYNIKMENLPSEGGPFRKLSTHLDADTKTVQTG